jgi:predicted enzyme related to lactoylglutathione lyase
MNYQGLIWAGLYVEDLESSSRFYRDVMGLPLLGEGNDWAHFDSGNGSLLELFSGGKASMEPKMPDQQSITVGFRVENLESSIVELKRKGVRFIGDVGEYAGTRWAHFSDLEGNQLEIKEVPPPG